MQKQQSHPSLNITYLCLHICARWMWNKILKRPHTDCCEQNASIVIPPHWPGPLFTWLPRMVNRSAPVFVWWAGKRGHAIHGADDWQVGPLWQLFSRYQDIFPMCSHFCFFFLFFIFSVSCLILTKCSRFWHASIFCAPVTNKEIWAAESQRCEGGSLLSGADTAGTAGAQMYNNFFYPLTGKFQYFSIMSLYLHVWCVNDLYQPNVLECSSGATQLTVTIWLYYNPLGRLGLKVTPN